jgi:CHAT domain-containing protein
MTRLIIIGALLALMLPISGSHTRSSPSVAPRVIPHEAEAQSAYQQGHFKEALALFRQIENEARSAGDAQAEVGALVNRANCHTVLFDYQEAMEAYLRARDLAAAIADPRRTRIEANLAQLHAAMGDYAKAAYLSAESLKTARDPQLRSYLFLYLGNAHHRLEDPAESDRYFQTGIAEARTHQKPAELAALLDHYALALIERNQAQAAEPFVVEARSLREQAAPRDVPLSDRTLGRLRLAQGRAPDAIDALNRAIAAQASGLRVTPIFQLLADRARAHAAAGNRDAALADFRLAFDYTRRWRLELLPASGFQSSWENELRSLRSSFLDFAAPIAEREQNRQLVLETLATAEESRLASLRSEIALQGRGLPAEHALKASQLQRLERDLVSNPDARAQLTPRIESLRAELNEIETRAGGAAPPPVDPLDRLRRTVARLSPDHALISFSLGDKQSWRWEITRGKIGLRRLEARGAIREFALRFRAQVQKGEDAAEVAQQLYTQILGEISPLTRTASSWTLALDGPLFDVPFAALRPEKGGYLVEHHSIQTIPSLLLDRPVGEAPRSGRAFLGVADPVLNRADPRRLSRGPFTSKLELPRLVSAQTEVDRCAAAWGPDAQVLAGVEASPQALERAVSSNPPAVIHFATHFLQSPGEERRTFLALSSPRTDSVELLGGEQIRSLTVRDALVVLSGCHSGAGQSSPAGLLGLTRSWLVAGAREVAASYWPTPDEHGEIFTRFYRHYSGALPARRTAASALQQAQIELIQQPGWRSSPRYWAAFFLVSKG